MSSPMLAETVIDRLRRQYPAYHETAYLFILSGLHFTIEGLTEPRHISGRELAEGCRDLALERYGPMARSVLEFWGIRTTRDLGEIVFALVDCGVLVRQEGDTLDEFDSLYDFAEVLERRYPWAAPLSLVG